MPYSPESNNRRAATSVRFRAGLNVAMGCLYILLGTATVALQHFGTLELDRLLSYFLGGLFLLYGIFRIWRGRADFRALRDGHSDE